jgi:hypothetical protein
LSGCPDTCPDKCVRRSPARSSQYRTVRIGESVARRVSEDGNRGSPPLSRCRLRVMLAAGSSAIARKEAAGESAEVLLA